MNTLELERILTYDPTLLSRGFCIGSIGRPQETACSRTLRSKHRSKNKPGKHRVAIYVFHTVEWLGSISARTDENPYPCLKRFLQTFCVTWEENAQRLQDDLSTVCGHYVIYYGFHRCRLRTFQDVLSDFSTVDRAGNDAYVKRFVEHHFNDVDVACNSSEDDTACFQTAVNYVSTE